jgi:hypothetical protein
MTLLQREKRMNKFGFQTTSCELGDYGPFHYPARLNPLEFRWFTREEKNGDFTITINAV